MGKPAELAIKFTGDPDDATKAFDSVTSSAEDMGRTVDRASSDIEAGASRLDRGAEAADNMASRSSQAAGGLGDLGGALAQLPGPLGAMGAGMEAAAPTIMGVTGASDLMNLAMSSSVVTTTRAKVAAAAHAVTSGVQAAATRTVTVAQRALNLAMRANPIGLAVTAGLLLAGLLVTLYRRSETFRGIVQRAMAVARAGFQLVTGAAQTAVTWVGSKVQAAVSGSGRVIGTITSAAKTAWDKVTTAVGSLLTKVGSVVSKVGDIGSKVSGVKTTVVNAFQAMLTPVETIIDAVETLIGKIKDIKLPDVDLTPWNRSVVRAPSGATVTQAIPVTSADGGDTVHLHLPLISALDDVVVAQLVAALTEFYRRRGLKVQLVPA